MAVDISRWPGSLTPTSRRMPRHWSNTSTARAYEASEGSKPEMVRWNNRCQRATSATQKAKGPRRLPERVARILGELQAGHHVDELAVALREHRIVDEVEPVSLARHRLRKVAYRRTRPCPVD